MTSLFLTVKEKHWTTTNSMKNGQGSLVHNSYKNSYCRCVQDKVLYFVNNSKIFWTMAKTESQNFYKSNFLSHISYIDSPDYIVTLMIKQFQAQWKLIRRVCNTIAIIIMSLKEAMYQNPQYKFQNSKPTNFLINQSNMVRLK